LLSLCFGYSVNHFADSTKNYARWNFKSSRRSLAQGLLAMTAALILRL
jgi:hypothetical protein